MFVCTKDMPCLLRCTARVCVAVKERIRSTPGCLTLFPIMFEFPIFEKPVIVPASCKNRRSTWLTKYLQTQVPLRPNGSVYFSSIHTNQHHRHYHEKGKAAELFSAFISIFFSLSVYLTCRHVLLLHATHAHNRHLYAQIQGTSIE